tara:strand:+ start:568 stop:855 length:288 start_codon:yes stop_codon:yes gene_type:complete
MENQSKKDVYIGYVGEKKVYDSGVSKFPISFRKEQLDEMKKFASDAGNVNMDLVMKTDGTAFISVFNPRHPDNAKYAKNAASQVVAKSEGEDLPF